MDSERIYFESWGKAPKSWSWGMAWGEVISHIYIKPATPRLKGKVERSHRIDNEEFYRMLDGIVIDDTQLFNDKLQEWENFYNFNRPHGGLDGQTQYQGLRQKTKAMPDSPKD